MRNLIPHLLPIYLLLAVIYLTWEVLELKPVRSGLQGAYLRLQPSQKMWSYLAIFVIGGGLLCFFWWAINSTIAFLQKENPKQTFTIPAEPPATAENIDSLVRSWVSSFEGEKNEIPNTPENYFTYGVRFSDGRQARIFRSRGVYDRFVTFHSEISIGKSRDEMSKWPNDKKQKLRSEIQLEADRARINCMLTSDADGLPYIEVRKALPITPNLTDITFFDYLHQIHSEISLFYAVLDKMYAELKEPTQHSPTPDKGASPH